MRARPVLVCEVQLKCIAFVLAHALQILAKLANHAIISIPEFKLLVSLFLLFGFINKLLLLGVEYYCGFVFVFLFLFGFKDIRLGHCHFKLFLCLRTHAFVSLFLCLTRLSLLALLCSQIRLIPRLRQHLQLLLQLLIYSLVCYSR